MSEKQETVQSMLGKRTLLVVDDERINREILGMLLKEDYSIIYAEDGEEALKKIRSYRAVLSLVLMDLLMPKMDGKEVLRRLKEEPELRRIPVIVLTSDQSAEVESLRLGAIDFIPKPYPDPEVIKARIQRTVELSEDRNIIRVTERDSLTGLYNREFFYRYAEQLDQYNLELEMDAIVVDINHFHMINERYGRDYGDALLRMVGEKIREMVRDEGGIVCRREADTFLIYCPHRGDYREILAHAAAGLTGDGPGSGRFRLRMGVYPKVDKSIQIERRFDRAKMAADTIRNSFVEQVAEYDNALHESALYAEQLLEDFQAALDEHQFKVYYQPKFDIRPDIPVLSSAEALVRWEHPELGMISPGVFIPLFEENGLIRRLDSYVWREAAAQIRDWKERFGFAVPVSVNVSRIDMYDPNLIPNLQELLTEYGITASEYLLEITESAYTQDSAQIIDTVNHLRALGFRIEMDDFGTGYSSLNMISSLPIDALKLDMQFIRAAFRKGRDTHMLEVIIDIADYLSVPVIAEGVETEEQLNALKAMGCDIVQGYYFSKPLPPEEYEHFLLESTRPVSWNFEEKSDSRERDHAEELHPGKIVHALSRGYETIYYVDTNTGHYVKFGAEGKTEDLQMQSSGADFFEDAQKYIQQRVCPDDRIRAALSMEKKALLDQIAGGQLFSLTYRVLTEGEPEYCNMRAVKAQTHDDHHIVIGLSNVDDLMQEAMSREELKQKNIEFNSIARALAADYFSIYYIDLETDQFVEYSANEVYRALGLEASGADFFGLMRANAPRVVYREDLDRFLESFTREKVIRALQVDCIFNLSFRMMLDGRPTYVSMKANRMSDPEDMHVVMGLSNIDPEVRRETELIAAREKINRDALTGVKSRHAYLEMEKNLNRRIALGEEFPLAAVVCDINNLKAVNDTLGHAAGDETIKKASSIICNTFKHSPVFRIGGDEFAVILQGQDFAARHSLVSQMQKTGRENAESGDVVVAIGFSDYVPGEDRALSDIFSRADADMYRDKREAGRSPKTERAHT